MPSSREKRQQQHSVNPAVGNPAGKIERRGTFGCLSRWPERGPLNRSAANVVISGMTKRIAGRSGGRPATSGGTAGWRSGTPRGELAEVGAAGREGLVTAAWLGNAGLAMARPRGRRGAHVSREELDRLVDATEKVRRAGILLNQVVRTMHATGQVRPVIEHIAIRVWARLEALDDAVLAVAGPLRVKRRRR